MQRPLATTLAGLAAVAAVVFPIVIAVKIANRRGLERDMDRTQLFAAEVLHRSDETDPTPALCRLDVSAPTVLVY